jgi:hypothetical protein
MRSHTRDAFPQKRYAKPRLSVYGDLSTLTQAVTNMGEMDGAIGKAHGTSLPPGPGMSADPPGGMGM